MKRAVYLTDPSTGQPWSLADANGFSGVVKDLDATADQMRFTTVWWEVVYGRPAAA